MRSIITAFMIIGFAGSCGQPESDQLAISTVENLSDSNSFHVQWNRVDQRIYSLDIKLASGRTIAPCINSNKLQNSVSIKLTGRCNNGINFSVDQLTHITIYASQPLPSGKWNSNDIIRSVQPVNRGSKSVTLFLTKANTSKTLPVSWNRINGRIFSLDLLLADGTTIGPCIPSSRLGSATRYTLVGTCYNRTFDIDSIRRITIFASIPSPEGNWNPKQIS